MTFETWWDSTGRALFHGIGGRSLASSAFAAGAAGLTADLAAAREALKLGNFGAWEVACARADGLALQLDEVREALKVARGDAHAFANERDATREALGEATRHQRSAETEVNRLLGMLTDCEDRVAATRRQLDGEVGAWKAKYERRVAEVAALTAQVREAKRLLEYWHRNGRCEFGVPCSYWANRETISGRPCGFCQTTTLLERLTISPGTLAAAQAEARRAAFQEVSDKWSDVSWLPNASVTPWMFSRWLGERLAASSPGTGVGRPEDDCVKCLNCTKCAAACDCTGGPVVEPECTCYEVTGGHQPGCAFNRAAAAGTGTPAQKIRNDGGEP